MELKKLQNGSDIRGVAMDGMPNEAVNLTPAVAELLGKSFAQYLYRKGFKSPLVAVGTDSRLTGPELKEALLNGLRKHGVNVLDCGLATTPAMFMSTVFEDTKADGSVMLTASHLPFNRNGMKFFTQKGGLDKADISEILDIASITEFSDSESKGTNKSNDLLSTYANFLVDTIRKGVNSPTNYNQPLNGIKIIVDAGNGSGGFFAGKVLEPLGANTSGSQFLEPDGNFPNHVPNPEDAEAMDSICQAVVKEKADLGIIFDTDVDRAAIVDSTGAAINRNELIALISAVVLEEHPRSVVVTDSITSQGLTWFIQDVLGGVHHRYMRGYKNVINESIRLNSEGKESWLAIETSGHAALQENYFLDDGAFLVAKLLIKMAQLNLQGKSLPSLIEKLPRPAESIEVRYSITNDDFASYGKRVLDELTQKVKLQSGWVIEEPNYEGIRVNCTEPSEDGWFLLRLSLHDPVMPLNIESNVEGGVEIISSKLKKILGGYTELRL